MIEMITCRRCGNHLYTSKSQAQEYGAKCLRLQRYEDMAITLADSGISPDTIRKAQEDIADGAAVLSERLGQLVCEVVSSEGLCKYIATPGHCTCKAGQFKKYVCRHRVDAMILFWVTS
jgi:hypothetical protein